MDSIYSLPAFVKIGSCFTLILVLSRCRLALGWAVLVGTLLLTISTGTGLHGFVYLARSFIAHQNVMMLLVIILLTFFSDALAHTGRMEKAIGAMKAIIKNQRALMGGLPAMIGLLPMPGGALFSAPFLSSVDGNKTLAPEHKSAINYWFRHIWEYWWPLYPGVILAVQYSNLPFGLFLLILAPFTLASIAGGWFFLLRKVPASTERADPEQTTTIGNALMTLWPILLLVAVSAAASLTLPLLRVSPGTANLAGMLGALAIALAAVFKNNWSLFKKSCRLFSTSSTWLLILVIAGVLAFSSVLGMPLDRAGTSLVSLMRDEFMQLGIPMVIIIALIPFVSAFVTGFSVGFVGAGFPIIFALLGSEPPLNTVLATTSLAYVSGYLGLMISPVHLCFLLSNVYFKVRMTDAIRLLLGPLLVIFITMIAASAAYFYCVR